MSQKVTLFFYDVLHGQFKSASDPGNSGIFFVTVVVFGKEYYHGNGICHDAPKKTPFGIPSNEIDIGYTQVPQEIVSDFFAAVKDQISSQNFSLLNANTYLDFAQSFVEFLTGDNVRNYAPTIPPNFFSSIDESMKSSLVGLQKKVLQNSHPLFGAVMGPEPMQIEEQKPPNPNDQAPHKVKPMMNDWRIFRPGHIDFFKYDPTNYPPCVKNINAVIEGYPLTQHNEIFGIYKRFADNPLICIKNFVAEEKVYLVNWILETLFYIGVSEKTIGFVDLLRMLSVDQSFLEIILKNDDKLYQLLSLIERTLPDLTKNLKLLVFKLITNLTATEKCKGFFEYNLGFVINLLDRAGNMYREEAGPFQAVLMIIWNLVQTLSGTKAFSNVSIQIGNFILTTFNNSVDNQTILVTLSILCWICYNEADARNDAREKIDKGKLLRLEFAEDPKVGKMSRDLVDLLQIELIH